VNNTLWYSEARTQPNTLVRFDPKTETFQSWAILGIVRNIMPRHADEREDFQVHVDANEFTRCIHNRMPVLLGRYDYNTWQTGKGRCRAVAADTKYLHGRFRNGSMCRAEQMMTRARLRDINLNPDSSRANAA